MPIISVDPGKTGALAVILGDRVTTRPLPLLRATGKGETRTAFDPHGFLEMLAPLTSLEPRLFAIEKVGGISGQDAARAFNFGHTCGAIYACIASFVPADRISFVPPGTWRGALGVTALVRRTGCDRKDASREVASLLWPADAHQWANSCQDGHAEAALIGEYARRFIV